MNQRPLGYEPNELPGCSTPHSQCSNLPGGGQMPPSGPVLRAFTHEKSSPEGWLNVGRTNVLPALWTRDDQTLRTEARSMFPG